MGRDIIKGHPGVTSRGSDGASPYRSASPYRFALPLPRHGFDGLDQRPNKLLNAMRKLAIVTELTDSANDCAADDHSVRQNRYLPGLFRV